MATETNLERYEKYTGLIVEPLERGVVRISFRQGAHLAHEQHAHLSEIWIELDRDPQVRVVLLGPTRGVEGAREDITTYTGETVGQMERMATQWELLAQLMHETRELVQNMLNFSKPVVSMFPGSFTPAVILADISIATRDSTLFDAHINYGGVAGDHVVAAWPVHMSMAKVKYYAMTGEPITGVEAERIGLISLVVDNEEELERRGQEIAQRLARGSQRALSWTKRSLNYHYKQHAAAFDLSAAFEQLTFLGPDIREGINGMRNGHAPEFPEYTLPDSAFGGLVPQDGPPSAS
ncbi:enoyl-CoA hydratase-related protein [Geodermatophilus sp. URMC 63]